MFVSLKSLRESGEGHFKTRTRGEEQRHEASEGRCEGKVQRKDASRSEGGAAAIDGRHQIESSSKKGKKRERS